MAAKSNASMTNTTVKRIKADIREMTTDPSDMYTAAPLEDNMLDWHFTIRGPPVTEFEGGVYHGRILLPTDYPFKPPHIILLTPNGRFQTKQKICLSISAYHPEHWQPAWGVRLILEALISFMPTKGEGAVGALDYSPEERRRLAKQSLTWCCNLCGCAKDLLPAVSEQPSSSTVSKYASQIAQMHIHNLDAKPTPKNSVSNSAIAAADVGSNVDKADINPQEASAATITPAHSDSVDDSDEGRDVVETEQTSLSGTQENVEPVTNNVNSEPPQEDPDLLLQRCVIAVAFALIALILRKVIRYYGFPEI